MYSPEYPSVGQGTEFDGSSSNDPDGMIVAYRWSFGDGGAGSGSVATHVYDEPGEYTVTLTVTDNDGASDSVASSVGVSGRLHALLVGMDHRPRLDGRADAELVYRVLKSYDMWAKTNPPPLILDPKASGYANASLIEERLREIEKDLRPDDVFVFYFSGHGGPDRGPGGDETPVWIDPWWLPLPIELNAHDEYLVLQRQDDYFLGLSDDSLASWLGDALWDSVDKLIVLDACYSGGFWGDYNLGDEGDLEKLPRVGLFASQSLRGHGTSTSIFTGRGIFTQEVVSHLQDDGTIQEMAAKIPHAWTKYDGQEVYLRMDPSLISPDGSTIIFDESCWDPVFYCSEDFTLGFPRVDNLAPIADAGTDQTVTEGREATLDGSGSYDSDSTPGTNDDIVVFHWYEGDTPLGTGEIVNRVFPLGTHVITLILADTAGLTDTDEVIITVVPAGSAGDVSWVRVADGCPMEWTVAPSAPGTLDVIHFSGPTAETFSNSCVAEVEMGVPTLAIDSASRTIELCFEPMPSGTVCPTLWDPVCGLESSFGPLEAGLWRFFGQHSGAAFETWIEVGTVAPVYRFWSDVLGRHFYTISAYEKNLIVTDPSLSSYWTYESVAYHAFATNSQAGLAPVYRFWSDTLAAHFYAISEGERDYVLATWPDVWAYEGPVFYAYPEGSQPAGTKPVYRFWSASLGGHFYTISEADRDYVLATWPDIWTYETIAWYAYE